MELALHGSGRTSPNPLVGCVIVENNSIIGEGFHAEAGKPHAEVNAFNNVKQPERLKGATLYVNLEPCAHFGKTPPCAPLIVEKGIQRVVIANRDPFEAVDGRGIDILRKAGIEVIIGCEEESGEWLNRRFFTFHRKKRPYIILKLAQSANGLMDRNRESGDRGVNWITAPETQYLTHTWRSEEDAILIGTRTAQIDNPSLTVRRIEGRHPHRLLIDRELSVPANGKIFNEDAPTTVFNDLKDGKNGHVNFVQLDFTKPVLNQIASWCYQNNLQSILVEGGANTIDRFAKTDLWDEARIITGQPVFDSGLATPEIGGEMMESYQSGLDQITIIRNR